MLVNYDSSSEEEQSQNVIPPNLATKGLSLENNAIKDSTGTEKNQLNKKRPISEAYEPESEEEYQNKCPVIDKYLKTEETPTKFSGSFSNAIIHIIELN